VAVRYEMTMNRQHRQILSQIGVKSRKLSRTLASTGNTSCQYCTAGLSSPADRYGTTIWTKRVINWRWSAPPVSPHPRRDLELVRTCDGQLALGRRRVVGLEHQTRDQGVAVQLQEFVDVLLLLRRHHRGHALGHLLLAGLGQLVEDLVVKVVQLDDLVAEERAAVGAEVLDRLGGRADDLLGVGLEGRDDVGELRLEELGMHRGPVRVPPEDHDGGEPQLLVGRDLDEQGHQLREDDVLVPVHHAAHGAHGEQRRLQHLPVRDRGRRGLASVLVHPQPDGVQDLGQALGDAHDFAGVLERISHAVAEVPELFLQLAVAVEEVEFVALLRPRILQVLEHDVHQLREDVVVLEPGLHVPLQHEVLLQLVPEIERVGDDVPFRVPGGALEQRVDQGPEVEGFPRDPHDPRVARVREQPGEGLVRLGILLLDRFLDPRAEGGDAGQQRLDRLDVLVDVSRLVAYRPQAFRRHLQGVVVAQGVDDDVEERRLDHGADRDFSQPRRDALDQLGILGCGCWRHG